MAQLLRTLTALTEHLVLVPSPHRMAHNHHQPQFQVTRWPFLASVDTRHVYDVHTCVHTYIQVLIHKHKMNVCLFQKNRTILSDSMPEFELPLLLLSACIWNPVVWCCVRGGGAYVNDLEVAYSLLVCWSLGDRTLPTFIKCLTFAQYQARSSSTPWPFYPLSSEHRG